ncbi:L,D-transpeptidase family protein [Streptomyces sp. 3214.6]|uniref:L,D-transpeptidase family protein n=1 Tax=Streptomyces sp. 3214.6 TaxID=1882757 RepID=UPI00090BD549|nr:L,D-transpeptidase family protein [Streptomyces sp. 3214.6]SHH46960.1 L,D-peptidoglycan transpeptidase YkuD, ErfK/YbiS/YcfS/YnhG family [Streptomyces sp. 3214.6]
MFTHRSRAALLAASLLLTGCGGAATAPKHGRTATVTAAPGPPANSVKTAPQRIPGLGTRTWAAVPADADQVVVVTGRGIDSPAATVVLYRRTAAGWRAGDSWPAHNALRGWSDHHMGGDLRSPIGVYGLTDAGGLLGDPGTKLPYYHGSGFHSPGTGFEGESLEGSFDYVIAINYNREPGTSPLDWTRPLGAGRGGGIWLHVDHGGPTHGCVSIAEQHMKELLRALDPALHPVVVMGDQASLAR